MNSDELNSFLDKKLFAVLATTRKDGRAHAAPVGFVAWKNAF
jgi:nitroimidazol reductase NimA-like FMN-containing flavoprotein (pyridoxamine 5'-phosphate oxidase superfamily)